MRRAAGEVSLLFLLVGTYCGCGTEAGMSSPNGEPPRGGVAVVGSISDVDAWNEYVSAQSFAVGLLRRIHLRLAQELGDAAEHPPSFEPLLAESWSFSDDRRRLVFRLREARWSDGRLITAHDVRFTWRAQTSSEVGWIGADTKRFIRDVVAVDPRTVSFEFEKVYPDQLSDAVEGGILPEHVYGRIPFSQWRFHDWSAERVGSGPFLLERYRPGDEIVLRRNPFYFRENAPRLDRLVVRIVPDGGSLLAQLLAGALDYVEGVSPEDAERARTFQDVEVLAFDVPQFDYIGWNGKRPPFDDPAVRRAMTLATDRQGIVEQLLRGYGRLSAGPLLSFWWMRDPTLGAWPHDPRQAELILDRKGLVRRPGQPIRSLGDGRPFEVELITNAGNRLREAVLVKIQEDLRRVGVGVRLRPVEMKALRQRVASGGFDAYLGGWRFSGKLDLAPLFASNALPPTGNNVVAYRSPEMDRLLASLREARDWFETKPVYAAIQKLLHEDQPYTFLYEAQRLAVRGPRLRGVEVDIPADPLARVERWWVVR